MSKVMPKYQLENDQDDDLEPSDDLPAFDTGVDNSDDEEEVEIMDEGETYEVEEDDETEEDGEEEEKPQFSFKNQEELDAYIADQIKKTQKTQDTEEDETEEEVDEFGNVTLFNGYKDPKTGQWIGEAPEDWNDFARRILKEVSPKAYAPKVMKEIKNMTTKEAQEIEAINKEFDAEYDSLSSKGLVPDRNSKEGQAVNAQISKLGAEHGQTSITKSYELWKKIPVDQGGGLGYKKPAPKKFNPSKMVSKLIGSSTRTGAATKAKATIPYNKLHSARSIDELIED